jgi:hypothetical protein
MVDGGGAGEGGPIGVVPYLLDEFCQPGHGAAYGRRRDQDERFNRARAQDQEARGTGRHRALQVA